MEKKYKFDALSSNINRNLQYCSPTSPWEPISPYSDITELQTKSNLIEVNDVNGDISSIGKWSFYQCSNIKSVKINNIDVLPYTTFAECTNLSLIECNNVKKMEHAVFADCISLSSINCPNLSSIPHDAFYNQQAEKTQSSLVAAMNRQ